MQAVDVSFGLQLENGYSITITFHDKLCVPYRLHREVYGSAGRSFPWSLSPYVDKPLHEACSEAVTV